MKLETHRDKRGTIKDIMVGKDFSVTYITFKKGAIRGNHYHKETSQMDYIISGKIECYMNGQVPVILESTGNMLHVPNQTHAYRALEDSQMISICVGKRIGKNYSKDTYKLEIPLV
jgi:quercetin dioxygenase-like cupin family protein